MKYAFIYLSAILMCILCSGITQAQKSGYHTARTFHIASGGGWDYIALNGQELYVSHSDHVNILDKATGDSVGWIPGTNGVHGIAFIPALNKGYTSNGKLNTVTVFDLSNHKPLSQITTGKNPDAILYDSYSKKVITCNGKSNDLSIIDPSIEKLVVSIPVGGKPETAVSDGKGNIFVNLEDKGEIVKVDLHSNTVKERWSLAPAEGPTGLAFDSKTNRLFAGCENVLVIIDAANGKLIKTLPIGRGCDGVVFDEKNKTIFTANGEGTVSVVKEKAANDYVLIENVITQKGARTIVLDEKTHALYLPTADVEMTDGGGKKRSVVPGTFRILMLSQNP